MDPRQRMLDHDLRGRGIGEPRVLAAMGDVPREAFVPAPLALDAYADSALPIEAGQTISQPYVVAWMIEAAQVRPGARVLDVGTGSGYAAAVAARLAAHVYSVERIDELCKSAGARLAALGVANVSIRCGDGTLGWPEHAPYDAILVGAGGPSVPRSLLAQLAVGGRLVIPVGSSQLQELVRVTRAADGTYERENLGAVHFVPLIGAHGHPER
ncbi:MAG TPA: protein-L-isoaspartate(D-aspartate) O-methyltransferase [Kofleriaceae bacterium]|jgi:protein-L-isoaspartate(D-aspartate) O-methyltransferase